MYKLCKTEQSAQRQKELEQGLLKAMLRQRFDEISVSDLCDDLGIPRKSFYRYFSSKDGALHAMLDHTMLEFFATGIGSETVSPDGQIEDITRFFRFWRQQEVLLNALQRNSLEGLLVKRAIDMSHREGFIPSYIQAMEPGVRRLALSFIVCGLLSMVIDWHGQGFAATTESMTQIAVELLKKPLIQ